MPPRKPIYLAGPTAVGKSAIALTLAERTDGEIVSADSMQVYRGLDIGSAKPTPAEQARVRHHLIDICDLNETFDAAQFTVRAKAAIDDIQSRDRTPIICGGTGLYFQALLAGLGDAPTSNPELRAKLEATPLEELRAELERADPVCFGRIDLQNPRRVIRAIEVIRLTGRPFSDQRADWSSAAADGNVLVVLRRDSEDLRNRINERVDRMFSVGLVDETKQLLKIGLAENQNAMQAIGYRQVVEHLEGQHSLAETIEWVKSRTRKFARRQMTWFRNQASPRWIDLEPEDDATNIAIRVLVGFDTE